MSDRVERGVVDDGTRDLDDGLIVEAVRAPSELVSGGTFPADMNAADDPRTFASSSAGQWAWAFQISLSPSTVVPRRFATRSRISRSLAFSSSGRANRRVGTRPSIRMGSPHAQRPESPGAGGV